MMSGAREGKGRGVIMSQVNFQNCHCQMPCVICYRLAYPVRNSRIIFQYIFGKICRSR